MKIIGKIDCDKFICEITTHEIANVFNKWRFHEIEQFKDKSIEVGMDINLGLGYKFKNDIAQCCREMLDANKTFDKSYNTLLEFSKMICDQSVSSDNRSL